MHAFPFAAALVATVLSVTPAFAACDTVNSRVLKLSACIEENDWVIQAPLGAQEFLFFSPDQKVGFAIISEAQTFSGTDFRRAVLINGKNANGGVDVRVLAERVETVADTAWNVIEYEFGTADQKLVFQNFYHSRAGFGSVQIVFWSVPGDDNVAAYRAGRLLGTVRYRD